MGNGAEPAPVSVDASTVGTITMAPAQLPDGKWYVLIIVRVPGGQVAYAHPGERVKELERICLSACRAAGSGLHIAGPGDPT